ncbi:hypothetical protein BJX63DRAFT_121778 [Aspergillus granulosus]|uniref:ABM domain-containing protein n=1 Tax=Aspergillus granulosus TaxID=176169 RepID=A0ABR4I452_9EURO
MKAASSLVIISCLSASASAVAAAGRCHNDDINTQISVTNIISIVNDAAKIAREKELLTEFIAKVKAHEPGVREFALNFDAIHSQYVTYERYASQADIDAHLASPYMAELLAAEEAEGLKATVNDVHRNMTIVTQFIR